MNSAVAIEARARQGGMPAESPLDMPEQDLFRKPPREHPARITSAALFARIILASVALGVSAYGIHQMLQVVRFASMTLLQGLMIFFFAVSLSWIAFAAGSVLAGSSKRREPAPRPKPGAPATLTALVMPIYNEDPLRTMTSLQAMAEALTRIGANRRLRDRHPVGFHRRRRLDPRDPRRRPPARRARRRDAGLVPAPLAERRAQVRQHRGLRQALGRPLRLHDRARRRQPARRGHTRWRSARRWTPIRRSASCRRRRC